MKIYGRVLDQVDNSILMQYDCGHYIVRTYDHYIPESIQRGETSVRCCACGQGKKKRSRQTPENRWRDRHYSTLEAASARLYLGTPALYESVFA